MVLPHQFLSVFICAHLCQEKFEVRHKVHTSKYSYLIFYELVLVELALCYRAQYLLGHQLAPEVQEVQEGSRLKQKKSKS